MMVFDQSYWDDYYQRPRLPWDMGHVSPPLKAYFDQLTDKSCRILIPGAGNAWEAQYLWESGFRNVHVLDVSATPLQWLKQRLPRIDQNKLLHQDFFEFDGHYDLIVEQTFFCSLHPLKRHEYARQMAALLNPGGRLVGVLFDFALDTTQDFPPFGGSAEEYKRYFEPRFEILTMERCYNSHPKRQDRELFINLKVKKA